MLLAAVPPMPSTLPPARDLLLDLRHAVRVLRRSPAFTFVALVTLALSIGANVVVLGVLDTLVFRPLPHVDAPGDIYQVRPAARTSGAMITTSYPAFEDMRRRSTAFRDLAAVYAYAGGTLRQRGLAVPVRGCEVSGNYFDLLGAQPQLGRFFHAADEQGPGSAPYIVLSDHLWRTVLHADPAVLDSVVRLDQTAYTVVGVAPAGFHGTERLERPDYWVPLVSAPRSAGYVDNRARNAVMVLGRLHAGVTPQQAAEDLNAVVAGLAREHPRTDAPQTLRLVRPGLFGDDGETIRRFLLGLAGLALLLLLAACTNLASLFAAHAADRGRELAVRVALGASRMRVVRQLLTEAFVIAVLGGAAGLASAQVLLGALNRWSPSFGYGGQRLGLQVELTGALFLVAVALTVAGALAVGWLPAWSAWRGSPRSLLQGEPRTTGGAGRRLAMRDLLLGLQIVLCTVLITAALVAGRGLGRALQAPLGFEPDGAVLAAIDLGPLGLDREATLARHHAVLEAARHIPGVTAVGAARATPLGGGRRGVPVYRPDTAVPGADNVALTTRVYPVSPGYLEAARTRLLRGRDLAVHDSVNAPAVALVNETFARRLWGEASPLGQRFLLGDSLTEVVGVVEDGRYHDLTEAPQPALFVSWMQHYGSHAVLVVRSRLAPRELTPALRDALGTSATDIPVVARSWNDALGGVLFPARASATVLGGLGVLAALLAATGVAGMAAYTVSRRMREFGIRSALGAQRRHLLRAAVGRPVLLLTTGTLLGLFAGLLASRILERVAFQAEPIDAVVLAAALVILGLIGLAGSAIPARRALTVDPARLMRDE